MKTIAFQRLTLGQLSPGKGIRFPSIPATSTAIGLLPTGFDTLCCLTLLSVNGSLMIVGEYQNAIRPEDGGATWSPAVDIWELSSREDIVYNDGGLYTGWIPLYRSENLGIRGQYFLPDMKLPAGYYHAVLENGKRRFTASFIVQR